MNIVQKAKEFATKKHSEVGQTRKYTAEPYIVHPAEVVTILQERLPATVTDGMLAAAWLHDTVEHTNTTIGEIYLEFGPKIASYVGGLTDVSQPSDGNRATRKKIDRMHLSNQPYEVMTVKYADLISNSSSIMQHDPVFGKVYINELILILKDCPQGDTLLYYDLQELALKNSEEYRKEYEQSCGNVKEFNVEEIPLKNEAIEELKLARQQIDALEDINILYRDAINQIDDYFEYRNESEKDRKFIHGVLNTLTVSLKDL